MSDVLRYYDLGAEVTEALKPPLNASMFMLSHMLIDVGRMFDYTFVFEDELSRIFLLDSASIILGNLMMKTEHRDELMAQVERVLQGSGLDALNEYALLSFLKHQADEGDEAAQAQAKALLSELKLSNPQLAPLFGLEAKPQ